MRSSVYIATSSNGDRNLFKYRPATVLVLVPGKAEGAHALSTDISVNYDLDHEVWKG